MSFLTAEWRKLVFANYVIDPKVLEKHVPFGTELDLWEGKCYVSLIGFMFLNTKLLGVKIPSHVNFEEVNLRFYVKRLDNGVWKRGVVFIKEIVPKPAITFVANTLYKERYETRSMLHSWTESEGLRLVSYSFKMKNRWHSLQVEAALETIEIPVNSNTEFITEHYWGYAGIGPEKTNEYEVTHPRWLHYPVLKANIQVDFEAVYGKEFSFLNQREPESVMLIEGSEITIEGKKTIRY